MFEDEDEALVDIAGNRAWRKHGRELHRDGDRPAVVKADGTQEWYQNGRLHRDGDLPAVVDAGGTHWWYQHGQHRDGNLPARIHADGTQEWWRNGVYVNFPPE